MREALIERERLLAIAPHIIWPLRFVLPHERHLRPAWLIRLGLFLYDHLGGRKRLPASQGLRFDGTGLGAALKPGFTRGFAYSDCWVQDSRLVALNALSAREHGATILTRTRFLGAERVGGRWRVDLEDVATSARRSVTARCLVNAAGPWVAKVLGQTGQATDKHVRLIKGSHIVVPRLYPGEHAHMLQNADRRIVFTIPYDEQDFTLIGTTDVPIEGDPAKVAISREEIDYLCDLRQPVLHQAGGAGGCRLELCRGPAAYDDAAENASAVTRDYVLDLEGQGDQAPLLSVFGGKITTYRRLAEHALEKLAPYSAPGSPGPRPSPCRAATSPIWISSASSAGCRRATRSCRRRSPGVLAAPMARGCSASWAMPELRGSRRRSRRRAEPGRARLPGCRGMAKSADDVLWRRSKLGLHVPPGTRDVIEAVFQRAVPSAARKRAEQRSDRRVHAWLSRPVGSRAHLPAGKASCSIQPPVAGRQSRH
ncbi:MAG: glycerol-3-phosphate dehydrogenase [Aliidongia sp.]